MEKYFAIYSRKSKYTGKGESVENQIQMCRAYLKLHFDDEAAENAVVYEDEGFSGKNLNRPQFRAMMDDIKTGKVRAIVCYRVDRVSRNIGDFANLIKVLYDLDVGFITIKEQFDTTIPMGRAMMYISSVFSQLERETIADRIRDNLHELAKTGRWLGGTTPTGYESVGETTLNVDGKKKKAFHLSIKKDEAELVKLIFSLYLEENSQTKVEAYLLAHNYKTKMGKDFNRFAIKCILTNPVYMIADQDALEYLKENEVELYATESDFDGVHGIMAYNRTKQEQGKAHKNKPMNEWIVSVGKHEGLISGHDFVKVQRMLSQNKSKSYRKPRGHSALLSGILRCGECGDFMRPHATSKTYENGDVSYYYTCNMKLRSKRARCQSKNCNGNELDQLVIGAIKHLANDDTYFEQIRKLARNDMITTDKIDKEILSLKSDNEKFEKEINALLEKVADVNGTGAEKYVLEKINELSIQVETNKTRIFALEEQNATLFSVEECVELMRGTINSFASMVDTMTIEQKRFAVRTFVKQVIWDGENAHILFYGYDGEFPIEIDKVEEVESVDSFIIPLCRNNK